MSQAQTMGWRRAVLLVLVGALATGAVGRLLAAPDQSNSREDVLPALLTEVKGLRAAMEQMASAGPRVQLSVARLQLEEGRINTMMRRLDSIREQITESQRQLDELTGQQQRVETRLSGSPADPEREQLTAALPNMKREAESRRAEITRLNAEEAQLSQDIAVEQSRWAEISRHLDELDRALAGK